MIGGGDFSVEKPVVLVICDGLGIAKDSPGNAVLRAPMPFLEFLQQQYSLTSLKASGDAVGLLPGMIGNSEVGHLTIGAGRVVKSSMVKMHELILSRQIYDHPIALDLKRFAESKKTLHIIGLLSDGGVHSHELHMHSLFKLAVACGIESIALHPILDGRDVAPKSAEIFLERLEGLTLSKKTGLIASLQGRFYAMDRDKNWDRSCVSYKMLIGAGRKAEKPWREILAASYAKGIFDEFVEPVLLHEDKTLCDGDGIIFVNVRADRALQLSRLLFDNALQSEMNCEQKKFSFFYTGYPYLEQWPVRTILNREIINETLLDAILTQDKQRQIFLFAETEKYAHVTYFFNGMRELSAQPSPERIRPILVPSVKLKTYKDCPVMSAAMVTELVIQNVQRMKNSFSVVNFANADMVGHSGDLLATMEACRVLDDQLSKLHSVIVNQLNGLLIICADHGNAEKMVDDSGVPCTAHTTNPVPFIFAAKTIPKKIINNEAGLDRVASTILKYMGLKAPEVMQPPLF